MGTAARRAVGRRDRAHPGGERSRSVVLAGAPARRDGAAARAPPRRAHADRLRRRPLDGRRVVGAPALPRNATSEQAVARVHDEASRRRRIRRRDGHSTSARPDACASSRCPRTTRRPSRSRRPATGASARKRWPRSWSGRPGTRSSSESSPAWARRRQTPRICPIRSKPWSPHASTSSLPETGRMLRWASVLGVSFSGRSSTTSSREIRQPPPPPRRGTGSREFVERDPDVPGAFRFRHALIRDAAYEGLSYRRRRELHGRVAEAIEQREGASTGGRGRNPLTALLPR